MTIIRACGSVGRAFFVALDIFCPTRRLLRCFSLAALGSHGGPRQHQRLFIPISSWQQEPKICIEMFHIPSKTVSPRWFPVADSLFTGPASLPCQSHQELGHRLQLFRVQRAVIVGIGGLGVLGGHASTQSRQRTRCGEVATLELNVNNTARTRRSRNDRDFFPCIRASFDCSRDIQLEV